MLPALSDEVTVHSALRLVVRTTLMPTALTLIACGELTPLTGNDPTGPIGDDVVPDTPERPERPDGPDGPDEPDPETPLVADIDVDTNRDGLIDGADDANEDLFDAQGGAVFFANVDDDDGDGDRDRNDDVLGGADDLADLTAVRISGVVGLTDAHVVTLAMDPPAALERVRMWRPRNGADVAQEAGDAYEVLMEPTQPQASVVLPAAGDDVELLIEGLVPRTVDWDGFLRLTVLVSERANGAIVSEDSVELRVSPVIFPDNLQEPRTLFVMDLPDGGSNNVAFVDAMREALPENVELYTLNENDYGGDRWVQDNMELGYQMKPSTDATGGPGGVVEMKTAMQLERGGWGGGLDAFVLYEWIRPSQGYLYPGGNASSHNYGGNLEVAPPVDGFPFGRMLFGGGSEGALMGRPNVDRMNEAQVGFIDAQEIQGPAVMLSSEWLAVGHIDEIFQFVPDLTPDEGGKVFKVVIASPAMARDVLQSVQERGNGSLTIFEGRDESYTVDEILVAENFLALNEAAQARIDSVQETLQNALGLVDDDFRPVPVMFQDQGSGLVAAFNPGVQNLVTVGDRLFAPNPEGPLEDGVDAWQQAVFASLADTDLDVIFVDVFYSYHRLLGEAHCGTNVDRAPYDTAWWTE